MQVQTIFKIFDTITLVATVLTVLRIWKSGLSQRYPVLTAYLLFMTPYLLGPLTLDMRGMAYYRFWVTSEPILWLLEILLVRELCGMVLAQYRGLRSLARWMMYGGMVISTGISLLSLRPHIHSALSQRSSILAVMAGMSRGLNLALAVFLLIMLYVVSRYPVRLSRNVIMNTVVFTVFFLSNTLGSLLRTLFDRRIGLGADTVLGALSCMCAIVWLVLLTPAGEEVEVRWLHFSPNYEERLLGKLDAMNRSLLGTPE